MNISKVLLFLITIFTLVIFLNSTLSAEITEPIRDGDYIYIDDSKAYLKGTYSATHGEDIEHWAMTKQFTGDYDMAIGFDGEVAWPTKVLLEDWHYENSTSNTSYTFYYVTNFIQTIDSQDYGNSYNSLKYKFNHKIHIGYDNATNESIWQDVIGTVAYFDSQENDGTNYTITWHTEHSRLEQHRDISNRILANPVNYEFDGKNLWFITKNIPMTAGEMRKIVIEMDGKMEWGTNNSYKYDIIWKPSHQTIAEARAAGNLYVLDPYWNTSWQWYVEYTINHSMVDHAQTNFPLQLFFNINGFKDDAADLRVTDGSGNQLAREIEFYNSTTNNGTMWFNQTSLSNVTDDVIRLYGGNPSATEPAAGGTYGSQGVWNSNYDAVYHMNNNPSGANTVLNSVSDSKHGSPNGDSVTLTDSDYGKGIDLGGTSDWISSSTGITAYPFTMTIRMKLDTAESEDQFIHTNDADDGAEYFGLASINGPYYRMQVRVGTFYTTDSSTIIATGEYLLVDILFRSATDREIYLNGNSIHTASSSVAYPAGMDTLLIGQYRVISPAAGTLDGIVSFVSTKTNSKTNGEITTVHNNLKNPTSTGTAPFFASESAKIYYTDSFHYNATTSYNITIESDGTLTSNRSIVAADDINDTASSTGTTYLQVTNFDNAASIVRNLTFTGDDIDWYQAANLSGSYSMKNSSGTVQTVNDGNFTVNLVAGDYWIEQADISIVLLSQTPSIIYTNSTGFLNISYGITHSTQGLNNTTVSFIYRNYDYDLSDSNHSIRPPANDLASVWNFNGRILRAANRNESLNFENNATITGGDTYTWSGLDENSTKLTIVPVNSTYTLVYINATVHCIMPQMWYLDRTDQQEATKTQLPIHKTQNVLIKFWNFEIFKGNYDFLGVGYTDTSLHSNPALWPSDANPVNFYYVNSSYDPATGGDPITSGYAVYMGSLNASGWVDHVYSRSNSNYVRGFIDNNYLHTVINTTNISYLYFTSNTESSKPYYINMTNVATSTNRSFANTNTLWAGGSYPLSSQLYTPNFWVAFMKLNMSLDHKLYAADNNDLWGSSTMNRTNITQALFPPTKPAIDHFHFLGDTDYDMDGVYYGNFSIGCAVGSDPDGGDVTHNLTLHYDNKTFVAIINNTFTDKDITHNGVYHDSNFSSIPYYSQIDNYTLRLIATDDESESVTVWLGVNFSLDGSPRIITYSPETPVSSAEGENQTFSITTNLLGNVTWYLDSVEVFNETGVNSSSYSNDNAPLGLRNITVITTNTNGTNSKKWDWTVRTELWAFVEDSITWAISTAQYLVSSIGIVIVTAFSIVCILILMMLIGAALSVTRIIYR